MTKINTKALGEVEVDERQRISFADGILGFEFVHDYWLLDMPDSPFYWLQAADEPDVAFVLVQPSFFLPDYRLVVPQPDFDAIEVKGPDDLLDFAIVVIPEDPREMTANLLGPLLINRHSRRARQAISLVDTYTTKHPILRGLQERYGGGA